MTTITVNDIVRIDITEGPNLDGLIQPWLILNHEDSPLSKVDEISVRFDEVTYFLEDGRKLSREIFGQMLSMQVVGIEPLGGKLKSIKSGDFVITVHALGSTFRGHYNTRRRKGSLARHDA